MSKVGFVVGHPTQFEGPFFKYVSQSKGQDLVSVYYYNFKNGLIKDQDMKESGGRNWGIDLVSGYNWYNISKSQITGAKQAMRNNRYIMVSGYASFIALLIIIFSGFYKTKVGLRLDTVPWNNQRKIKRFLKSVLLRTLSLFVDTFWVTGSQSAEYVRSCGINMKRIKIFSYVTDNDWFREQSVMTQAEENGLRQSLGIDLNNRIILSIVKLVQRESPQELIQAFKDASIKGYSLVIVGDGELMPKLQQMAKEGSSDNEIVFTGYVPYTELPKIYRISSVFIHPSENEPWGVSVQEAMACGLPVIASDRVGAGYDLIEENVNGWMYPHHQVSALTHLLENKLDQLPSQIKEVNKKILSSWNYSTSWDTLVHHIDGFGKKNLT